MIQLARPLIRTPLIDVPFCLLQNARMNTIFYSLDAEEEYQPTMHDLSTHRGTRTHRLHKTSLLWAIPFLLLLGSCGKKEAPQAPATKPTSSTEVTEQKPSGVPVPTEEPSDEVLSKLEFQRYHAIEQAGGIPLTVTATGKSLTLSPKLYEARKDEPCKKTPQAPPGWYECSLTIKISLNGMEPSEQGERIGVKWDPSGEWVLQ